MTITPAEAIEALIDRDKLTEAAIGLLVGARQSTINRIRHGQMKPNYDVGKALVDLATSRKGRGKHNSAVTSAPAGH